MQSTAHPEVLSRDWVPPVLLGREAELADAVRRLDPPAPRHPAPWTLAIVGPPGAGTSALARRAAREVCDRVRAARPDPLPRVLPVRTGPLRGAHGVATALLQRLDDGFDGRGFPVNEILAGLLRRIRRETRPTVLVLDDLRVGGPDVGPVLRATAAPDRFLPEGEYGLPPTWTILAGTREAVAAAERSAGGRPDLRPYLSLAPYDERTLAGIVRDRLTRAVGPVVSDTLVTESVGRAIEDGTGASRAVDLIRRRLLGAALRPDTGVPARGTWAVPIEPRILQAIQSAASGSAARLSDVKRWEVSIAEERGERPLPATTLWRRIVSLERAGYVRREIRPGGTGGTLSIVRLLAPIDEWITAPAPWGSPRAVAAGGERSRAGSAPLGSARPPLAARSGPA
jgi:hypothetical protein